MSRIARGFVQDVIQKGEGDKAFAIVGITVTSKNRNGFEVSELLEFNIRGEQYKGGLHNAYRAQKGVEVFAPYQDEIDTFYKDNPRIRYSLLGIPLRLTEARPEQEQRPAQQSTAPKAVNS
ncbi:hypothetical protein D3C80_429680 [compost metagenome]